MRGERRNREPLEFPSGSVMKSLFRPLPNECLRCLRCLKSHRQEKVQTSFAQGGPTTLLSVLLVSFFSLCCLTPNEPQSVQLQLKRRKARTTKSAQPSLKTPYGYYYLLTHLETLEGSLGFSSCLILLAPMSLQYVCIERVFFKVQSCLRNQKKQAWKIVCFQRHLKAEYEVLEVWKP